jgi:hypothetical protein
MYEYNPHGMGSEPVLLNIGPQISSIDPEFAAQQQAARAAAEAGEEDIPHPEPGGFEHEEGLPWWVWGVGGVAILGAIGGGVWWWMKRGESEEE